MPPVLTGTNKTEICSLKQHHAATSAAAAIAAHGANQKNKIKMKQITETQYQLLVTEVYSALMNVTIPCECGANTTIDMGEAKDMAEFRINQWLEKAKIELVQQEMKDNVLTPHQKLEALRARLNGEWDNPQLLKIDLLNNIKNDLHTILSSPTTDLLINFYPQEAAIVWDAVEVHPVYEDGEGTAEICEEGDQTYFSVYLHLPEGGINCIADFPTIELAIQFAGLIRNIVMYR